jgi:hypothetical protein
MRSIVSVDEFAPPSFGEPSTCFTKIDRSSEIFIDKLHTNGNILW